MRPTPTLTQARLLLDVCAATNIAKPPCISTSRNLAAFLRSSSNRSSTARATKTDTLASFPLGSSAHSPSTSSACSSNGLFKPLVARRRYGHHGPSAKILLLRLPLLRRQFRTQTTGGAFTANIQPPPDQFADGLPPHRRRQARKQTGAERRTADDLPANASTILTDVAAAQPAHSLRRTLSTFLSLSKPRLTVLVVLTAMAPYALYPVPEMLTPTMTETPSLSPLTLLFLTTGTALCSASANALNMLYEPSTDAMMTRTRNRPLVRHLVSPRVAALFAILAGATGVGALFFGVNPTVSFLGLSNIVLYAGIYTPLKAVTAFNTWFPHFMALSWSIRDEYRAAGLRMLAWTNPGRNARVALRYSVAFLPLCLGLCAAGLTEWSFAVTSLPVNAWLIRQAVQFWRFEGHKGSARGLFWASVVHLPGIMILALLHKKGMWSRAWKSVFGDDGGEWEDDELEEMVSMTAANPSGTSR
ncbi:protoheme IX farnesyltransferase [Moelleriella libera RCEF 2490]|uniref:Heme O synthase n=1 Tax=Moelleriella libera RCEF 2490 TaxID=1081109 RepID=A0A168CIR8_9HYPO|nr:protoheme IX farnesyltransferase [Moelleriella libera RCEF 2490]